FGMTSGIGAFDGEDIAIVIEIGFALRSASVLGNVRPAAGNLAALADHACPVAVFELDKMMVEDLPVAFGIAQLPPTHPLSANRVGAFDPVHDVDVMHMLLDDVIAREPGEIIPVANLVVHFLLAWHPFHAIARAAIPIAAQENQIAQSAILDPFDGFDVAGLVTALEADAN